MKPFLIAGTVLLLGACVAAAPERVAEPARLPPQGPRADAYCAEQRQEARAAERNANREERDTRYGGRRQDYEAAAARNEADRQRAQAARAC